jgi:hypothetical protein
MKAAALALALVLGTGSAFAQHKGGERQRPAQAMSKDDRQRMRKDMQEVYRERGDRGARPERPRQMSPQEREQLRQDVQNANKDLRR